MFVDIYPDTRHTNFQTANPILKPFSASLKTQKNPKFHTGQPTHNEPSLQHSTLPIEPIHTKFKYTLFLHPLLIQLMNFHCNDIPLDVPDTTENCSLETIAIRCFNR